MSLFHPRNRHQGRYDFDQLIVGCPDLGGFVAKNKFGERSIDFANPEAVRALNRALLTRYYGLKAWEIPQNYLCPPIPGRADHIHQIADLLASRNEGGEIPRGGDVRVLDIGVGANAIYPIIGHFEYGWSFVGTDIDEAALKAAEKIVRADPKLAGAVELRHQADASRAFEGVVRKGEEFDVVICNPPFHASMDEAAAGTRRKWNNLGKARTSKQSTHLNFGGQSSEICCEGGELGFVRRMIEESVAYAKQSFWFTTLVSKESNLPPIYGALDRARALDVQTLEMAQGQKKSRIVAWTFM